MSHASLTIHEAAKGLREKKFSSVELTKACLARIKKHDGAVKAYTCLTEDSA